MPAMRCSPSPARRWLGLPARGLSAERTLEAFHVFDETCLRLTEGQYLDMSFENRMDVTVDEYLTMIAGKTAALVGASLELGALVGAAAPDTRQHLAEFGRHLGLAFQIQDDILGIWGDEALTGKSAESDILTRKKSLPVSTRSRIRRLDRRWRGGIPSRWTSPTSRRYSSCSYAPGLANTPRQMAQQATDRHSKRSGPAVCFPRGIRRAKRC